MRRSTSSHDSLHRLLHTPGISGQRLLVRIVLSHWRTLLIAIAALICVDLLQILVVPTVIQNVINRLSHGTTTPTFLYMGGLAIIAASIGVGIGRFVWRVFLVGNSVRIERDVRSCLYEHLQKVPATFYDRQKIGDITAHVSNDTQAIQRACGFGALAAIDSIIMATGVMAIMLYKNVPLTFFVLAPLPLLTFIVIRFGRLIHHRFMTVQSTFSRITEHAQETFSAIRVVKAYGEESREISLFTEKSKDYIDENIHLVKVWAVFDPAIMALANLSMALLIGIGGRMVINGTFSLGEFVAFSTYLGMFIWPMIAIGVVVNHFQRGAASMERIQTLLATPQEPDTGTHTLSRVPHIRVNQLSFTYPETTAQVLDDISLSIAPGSFVGIVGDTGSGKTTLLELIMRLYEAPHGSLLYDDIPLPDIRNQEIRRLFAYVPQTPFLFAMSIAENIRFGIPECDDDTIIEYARRVRMHDEIMTFPDGYNTRVGERGITLSGGQKQRISLARALIRRAPILVLDDALSSVDAETEHALLNELIMRRDDTTRIIVAHRVSTVKDADKIIVMEHGRITATGIHDDLVAREGYYCDLTRLQSLEDAYIPV